MASGDRLITWSPQASPGPQWLYSAFTSGGTTTPSLGATVWGDTSNANGVLEYVELTSGSWGGGDAAGFMFLSNWNGTTWTATENFTFNSTTPANHGTFSTPGPTVCTAPPDLIRSDVPTLSFDATTNQVAIFQGVMPAHYAGGGVTLTVGVVSTTATGDMSFGAAFRSNTDDVDNLGAVGTDPSGLKTFAAPNLNQAIDAATVAGEVKYFTITFTDGADMDSVATGELFHLLLYRDAQDATNDDMAAAAQVVFAVLDES